MWTAKLAAAYGLRVIFVTSDISKAIHLHPDSLGVISYLERPNWSNEVLDLTNGHGADFVLELGGNSSIQQSLSAAAFGGHIALVGGLGGWTYGQIDSLQLIAKGVTTHGIYVGSKRSLKELLQFSARESVAPHISSTFAFEDAHAAFSELAEGKAIGKIVIDVNHKI
jgi:NADPH:quinone reductase-like Zn-dependent oxidoreductase